MVQVGGNVLDTGPVMLAPGEQPLVSSEDPRIPDKGNRLGKCSHRHGLSSRLPGILLGFHRREVLRVDREYLRRRTVVTLPAFGDLDGESPDQGGHRIAPAVGRSTPSR